MTRNRKLTVVSMAGALALLLSVPVLFATHRRGMAGSAGRHHGFAKLHQLQDELQITDAQKKSLHEIFDRARAENTGARKSLHEGLIGAAQRLLVNPDDIAGAREVFDRQQAAKEQLATSILGSVSEAVRTLTPEQRLRLSVWLSEHAAERD